MLPTTGLASACILPGAAWMPAVAAVAFLAMVAAWLVATVRIPSELEMTRPPLLLVDVDGVICPLGPGPGEPMDEVWSEALQTKVRIPAGTPGRLDRLAAYFRLAWATSWGRHANLELSPALQLPSLPTIRFKHDAGPGETWKLPSIKEFVGDQPFAWLDDDIGNDALEWASQRSVPTLLVAVEADRGLDERHVSELIAFARPLIPRDGGMDADFP